MLLVGNYRPDRQFSMLGFERAMVSALPGDRVKFEAIHPSERLGRLPAPAPWRKWLGYADKYLLFPSRLRRAARSFDVVHVLDQGNGMWVPSVRDRPVLVTCHDLMAIRAARGEIPGWSVGPSGQRFQKMIEGALRLATHLACDSQATLQDAKRLLSLSEDRLSFVPISLLRRPPELNADEIRSAAERYGLANPNGYLLHVGGGQPYKNRHGLLSVLAALERRMGSACPKLALAGHPLNPATRNTHAGLFERRLAVDVVRPDDRTLWALYAGARALVFPSLLEGFGLPILEAQAVGCPVVTSNRAPMTEVAGEAAEFLDPTDPESGAEAVMRALGRAEELRRLGYENVRRFSTEAMIEGYLRLYERLAG
ncbi:MAG: glycosyltransferase family 4 protein [Fimbriimonadales bacterium]|nr:glycosyltransferase family 4 protein [Fimbriimonadales bacterium]